MAVERRTRGGRTIVALTAEDDRFLAARTRAQEIAREAHAKLILYDWDAAMVLADPLPSFWSADTADPVPDQLDETALEAAGRHQLAMQVRMARQGGVPTVAWLPSSHDPEELLAYARDHDALAIVVPEGFVEDALGGSIVPSRVTASAAGTSASGSGSHRRLACGAGRTMGSVRIVTV
jgi:hypothetical protein